MRPRWTALGGGVAAVLGLLLNWLGGPWELATGLIIFGAVFLIGSVSIAVRRRAGH